MARARVIWCLLVAMAVSGCGGQSDQTSSAGAQREAAERFATAVLHGDQERARQLLAHPDEAALIFLVRRAAEPWTSQHASLRLPARRVDNAWSIHYAGTRSHRDGTFEREKGDLVVYMAPASAGPVVTYFMFRNVLRLFSTHHDSQLPPSKR